MMNVGSPSYKSPAVQKGKGLRKLAAIVGRGGRSGNAQCTLERIRLVLADSVAMCGMD